MIVIASKQKCVFFSTHAITTDTYTESLPNLYLDVLLVFCYCKNKCRRLLVSARARHWMEHRQSVKESVVVSVPESGSLIAKTMA